MYISMRSSTETQVSISGHTSKEKWFPPPYDLLLGLGLWVSITVTCWNYYLAYWVMVFFQWPQLLSPVCNNHATLRAAFHSALPNVCLLHVVPSVLWEAIYANVSMWLSSQSPIFLNPWTVLCLCVNQQLLWSEASLIKVGNITNLLI